MWLDVPLLSLSLSPPLPALKVFYELLHGHRKKENTSNGGDHLVPRGGNGHWGRPRVFFSLSLDYSYKINIVIPALPTPAMLRFQEAKTAEDPPPTPLFYDLRC